MIPMFGDNMSRTIKQFGIVCVLTDLGKMPNKN